MRLLRLIPLVVVCANALPAQPPAPRGEYRIAGTVVSSIDNHPLQHATVDLLDPGDQKRPVFQTTTSDEYGHFAFTNVPAGNHILRGETRNYLPTEYDEHEGFTCGIVTGAGVDTEALTLKLHPQATIAGTVRDETNDFVPDATIHLYRQSLGFGDGRLIAAGFASTDDRGRFEFARLQPGAYYLVITARPWYATYPQPEFPSDQAAEKEYASSVLRREQRAAIADSIDPALDVAYPVQFYPGTIDPREAAPIQLRGGDSLDLSFTLSPVQAVSFTLPVLTGNGGRQQIPQLMLSFHGQNLPIQSQERQANGQITFSGLAPGDYTLYSSNDPTVPFTSERPIHITRETSLADLPATPGVGHIHAILHSADAAPLPEHLEVSLVRDHSTDSISAPLTPKGELTIEAPPGDYTFRAAADGEALLVRQVVSGEKPLLTNHLHVAADESATFTVLVGRGTQALSGYARLNGKPFAGALVLMFPSNQAGDIDNVSVDETNLDGSFQLSGMTTGTYTLLAIDDGWNLNWRRPEVLARYLGNALTIHIADTAETSQPLRETLAVQPR